MTTGLRMKLILLVSVMLAALAACTGGSVQTAGGGIGGTGVSQGPITGFGSIFVNGVEFDTRTATILSDRVAVTQNDLRIGMIVTVEGSINGASGTATTVTYTKELEGPISKKPNANTLAVLGQTIIIDNLTKIEVSGVANATINDLNIGDKIEVSGFIAADGSIHATYIGTKTTNSQAELKGQISAANGNVITLGSLQVNIDGAQLLGFGGHAPTTGDVVEVKGNVVGSILVATSIELSSRSLGRSEAKRAEVEGLVTSVTSAADFNVGAQRVQTTAQTTFGGGLAADIQPGVQLEVKGSLMNGILVATQVAFKDDLELEANVLTIDTVHHSMTLGGLTGITVIVNETLTKLEGVSDFAALTAGQHVKLRGRSFSDSTCAGTCVLTVKLEVENASPTITLQGPVEVINNPLLTVLGVAVNTTAIADSNFSGRGISDRTRFFANLHQGDVVKADGVFSGGAPLWQSIERTD